MKAMILFSKHQMQLVIPKRDTVLVCEAMSKQNMCYADLPNIEKFQSPKLMKDTHYLFLARIILHLIRPTLEHSIS